MVESHVHALGQCRDFLRRHGYRARVVADTAGAAADIAAAGDPTRAAIASRLAAEIYGLRDPEVRHRGRRAQHHPLPRPRPRAAPPGPQGRPGDHHLRLPGAQPAGRALQGAGRLRHQRRQHGQARELRRRRLHPGRVLRRHHGPPAARATSAWPSRSCASSRTTSRSWASTRPTGSASASAERAMADLDELIQTLLETATRSDDPAELITARLRWPARARGAVVALQPRHADHRPDHPGRLLSSGCRGQVSSPA